MTVTHLKVCVTCGETFPGQRKDKVCVCCALGTDAAPTQFFAEKFAVLDNKEMKWIWLSAGIAVHWRTCDRAEFIAGTARGVSDQMDEEVVALVRQAAGEAFDAQLNNAAARARAMH